MTPTRREAIEAGLALVPTALLTPALLSCVSSPGAGSGHVRPRGADTAGDTPTGAGPGTAGVPVGRLDALPPGSGQSADYRGTPVILLNVAGEVRVFSAFCTHEGCTVDWDPRAGILQCPCHDGRFAVDGTVLSGPPPAPLLKLDSVVRDGAIYVVEEGE